MHKDFPAIKFLSVIKLSVKDTNLEKRNTIFWEILYSLMILQTIKKLSKNSKTYSATRLEVINNLIKNYGFNKKWK